MVSVPTQTNRSKEQNRKSRNRPTHIQEIDFFYNDAKVTWCRKNNLLTNGTGAIKTAICK